MARVHMLVSSRGRRRVRVACRSSRGSSRGSSRESRYMSRRMVHVVAVAVDVNVVVCSAGGSYNGCKSRKDK